MGTIFDDLDDKQKEACNEAFDELIAGWDLSQINLREAFEIGFARGVDSKDK